MSGAVAALAASGMEWRYAAWVALDLRLLLFLVLISALGALAICAIVLRERRWAEIAAVFALGFLGLFVGLVLVFNAIANYPVFVVESFFPFP